MPFAPRGDKPPYVSPTVEPVTPQVQPRPTSPVASAKGEKGDKGDPGEPGKNAEIDYEKLAGMVAEKLANDPRCKGKDGQNGQDGKPGEAAAVDHEKLVNLVVANIDQRIAVAVDARIQQQPKQPTLDEIVAAVMAKMPPQPTESTPQRPKYFDIQPIE